MLKRAESLLFHKPQLCINDRNLFRLWCAIHKQWPVPGDRGKGNVIKNGFIRVKGQILENHGDIPLARMDGIDPLIIDIDIALVSGFQTDDQTQQGCFTGTRRAQNTKKLTVVDFQIEIMDPG